MSSGTYAGNPNNIRVIGERLAKSKRWAPYMEGLSETNARLTAMMLQNQLEYQANRYNVSPRQLLETTKVLGVGGWDKYAFPLIRSIYPNLISQDLVSVQPMAGPSSFIFYFDMLFSDAKGNVAAGSSLFDSRTGPANTMYYSKSIVPEETMTISSNNAVGATGGKLAKSPVRPGTVRITATVGGSPCVFTDDGVGGFIQLSGAAQTISSGTITYSDGTVTLDLSNNITAATCTYGYDAEANDNIMSLDLQLTGSPVLAQVRKLRARWSAEAQQNLNALHGIDAEAELVAGMGETIKYEIDQEIIDDLYKNASAGSVLWDRSTPWGVSWKDHKDSIKDAFIAAGNLVFSATKRAETNWIVAGVNVCSVIESHSEFKADGNALSTQAKTGIVKLGTLAGRWTVYKNPWLPANNWIQGYKGDGFMDTGYVYAPYVPIYTTPTVMLDDFMSRKGVGTQYGVKLVNSLYYATGTMTGVT